MTEDEAFVRAIVDSPGDDTPRLVYADWLEEHGDSSRAEALRLEGAWAAAPAPDELLCRWKGELPPPEERYLGEMLPEHLWVSPVPDSRVLPEDNDPAEIAVAHTEEVEENH